MSYEQLSSFRKKEITDLFPVKHKNILIDISNEKQINIWNPQNFERLSYLSRRIYANMPLLHLEKKSFSFLNITKGKIELYDLFSRTQIWPIHPTLTGPIFLM